MESYLDNFQSMNNEEMLLINGGAGLATAIELAACAIGMAGSVVSIPVTGLAGVVGAAACFAGFSAASAKI